MIRDEGELEKSPRYNADLVSEIDSYDKNTPDSWIPRHKSLIRLTGPHPLNAEPPTDILMEKGFITPSSLHYVRNHGAVPKLDWEKHVLVVTGLVEKSLTLHMDDLVKIYRSVKIPVTLTCDGNRRKEINMIRHTRGFNWGPGATSCAVWTGVKLIDVIQSCKPDLKKGKYVCFEGADNLPKGKYGTSIPLEFAMDPTNDILIAYEMNDTKLPPDHGFPVRMIIPGFVGGRMVKWLKKIEISEHESSSHYHFEDNRVLPPTVDFGTASPWFRQPETILYQLNINSTIVHPKHDEWLEVSKDNISKTYKLSGYAYSGGGRRVNRVELSFNEGLSWELCETKYMDNITRHGFKIWVWAHWELEVEIWKFIKANSIVVRAWDNSFNTQPKERTWNVLGMMNNSWYRVKTEVKELDTLRIHFLHPVVPGHGQPPSGHLQQEEIIKPFLTPSSGDVHTRYFPMEEVAKHNTPDSCWVIIDGAVYDVTNYLKDHPGGIHAMIIQGGRDATRLFYDIHASEAAEIKERFCIGSVIESIPRQAKGPADFALNAERWSKAMLIDKRDVSHNTRKFRFQVANKKLGLPVGQHILVGADIRGQYVVRPYTPVFPILDDDDRGEFDLVVKVYKAGENELFPNGGVMSQYLDSLKIGDYVQIKGPAGPVHYHGNGVIAVHGFSKKVSTLNMIAGGTGITPMIQLIRAIHRTMEDKTRVNLIFANHTVNDILLRDKLDDMVLSNVDGQIRVWYTVSERTEEGEWKYDVGRVDERMMRRQLSEPDDDTIVMLCGPPAMIEHACIPALRKIGFSEEQIVEF